MIGAALHLSKSPSISDSPHGDTGFADELAVAPSADGKGACVPILDWMTRSEDVVAAARVPYRMLEAVPELDGGDGDPANMLIQGDNLDALKALLPYYTGRVKCIYIDPPYNTRSAFEHYDDNLEHAQWLAMIYPRLVLLRELLAEDGSIWITLDDNEIHYMKVISDEVFGRSNYISSIAWQKVFAKKNKALISGSHDHILVYAKNYNNWTRNLIPRSDGQMSAFSNKDNDHRGPWQSVAYSVQSEDSARRTAYRYEIELPSGRKVLPPSGRHWNGLPDRTTSLIDDNRLWFGRDGNSPPRLKVFLSEVQQGVVPDTWWDHSSAGNNQESKKEQVTLFPGIEPFGTPKPEKLISKVVHIATNPGDLVLDSFLGSGTTAAVAQKMGRRWIGIEMGDHAETHCKPRLDKVIAGEQGGISTAVGWQGGGGYRYYRLGPPAFDASGRIDPEIGFDALAAHVWFAETGQPAARTGDARSPVLGVHEGTAYALLYNGVLGDRRPDSGNVLTAPVMAHLREELSGHDGPWTIYGEACRMSTAKLAAAGITFKQTPYDVKAR